jgi:hypothetical protein
LRLSGVDQTSQLGLPVGPLSHRSARLPAVRAMSSSSIDVSVPSSARRELAGLWRRLTTASTRADSEAAKLILLKALVHASPVVHSAAARFVVRLVVDQRLWTVDEGTEALLNAAAAASAAGSDEGLQSVVKEVGTLAVHRVITSQRGDGIVGAADGRAWQPFLKILKAAPGDLFTHRTTHSPTRSLVCPLTLVRMHTNTKHTAHSSLSPTVHVLLTQWHARHALNSQPHTVPPCLAYPSRLVADCRERNIPCASRCC